MISIMSFNPIPRVPDGIKTIILDDLRSAVNGRAILITGGTGFVGKWLLELICWGRSAQSIKPKSIMVMARRPERLRSDVPHLFELGETLKAVSIDCKHVSVTQALEALRCAGMETVDVLIHAAGDTSVETLRDNPSDLLLGNINMMAWSLEMAKALRTESFLFTSSGAAYGSGMNQETPYQEDSLLAPYTMCSRDAYGESKRCAEMMLACEAERGGVKRGLVARLFTFVGPYIPLDSHFAVSNFIRCGCMGENIVVRSPKVVRSYMHGFEMACVLIAILARGESCSIYNVGSDDPVNMLTLSKEIAELCGTKVRIHSVNSDRQFAASYYLPSMKKTWGLCGYRSWLSLKESIQQTIAWHQYRTGVNELAKLKP